METLENMVALPENLACEQEGINILGVGIDNWYEITIQINWLILLIGAIIILVFSWLYKKYAKKWFRRKITLDGMSFGIGDLNFDLSCGSDVQEIAYQLWVELTTRKIAVPIENDDVITEIYDSWYEAFKAIRELLKTVPGKCFDDAAELIEVTTNVLNNGLRPHLTKWQAKYRNWYEHEAENCEEPPQTIQKRYPQYDELMADMKQTNQNMINFANKMREIAFGK